ncbi:MAG: hypothetical protein RR977_01315, partial [Oscillospiraceae bacterium]
LIGTAQVISFLSHKFWCRGTERITFSVIPVKGHSENLEYLVRSAKAELRRMESGNRQLVVLDIGMDEENKQLVNEMQGVEILQKEELCSWLKSSLMTQLEQI